MATAWDRIAEDFKTTRSGLTQYQPANFVDDEEKKTPIPRLEAAKTRRKKLVTTAERQRLVEVQSRGAAMGLDTTVLKPKPGQSVSDMVDELNAAMDQEEADFEAWRGTGRKFLSPEDRSELTPINEQLNRIPNTPGEVAGGIGRLILGGSRGIAKNAQKLMPVDEDAIANIPRLQDDFEGVRNEIIAGIVDEQGQDVWDKYSAEFPTEAEQLVNNRMRDMIGVAKFATSGTPEQQLEAAQYQLKRQLNQRPGSPSIAESRIRAGSNPRVFTELALLPMTAAFAPQELGGGLLGAGAGHLVDKALGGDGSKGEHVGSIAGQLFGGGARNPASLRGVAGVSDDALSIAQKSRGLTAVTGLDFVGKEALEAAKIVESLGRVGLKAGGVAEAVGETTISGARALENKLRNPVYTPEQARRMRGGGDPFTFFRNDPEKGAKDLLAAADEVEAARSAGDADALSTAESKYFMLRDAAAKYLDDADPTSGQKTLDGDVVPAITEQDLTDRAMNQSEFFMEDEILSYADLDDPKYDAPIFDNLPGPTRADEIEMEMDALRYARDEVQDGKPIRPKGRKPDPNSAQKNDMWNFTVGHTNQEVVAFAKSLDLNPYQPGWFDRLGTEDIADFRSGFFRNYETEALGTRKGIDAKLRDLADELKYEHETEIASRTSALDNVEPLPDTILDDGLPGTEGIAASTFELPQEFSRISPRYRSHSVKWEDDFDRLLYQVSAKGKPSKRAADFNELMKQELGADWQRDPQVRTAMSDIRAELKRLDQSTEYGEEFTIAATGSFEDLKTALGLEVTQLTPKPEQILKRSNRAVRRSSGAPAGNQRVEGSVAAVDQGPPLDFRGRYAESNDPYAPAARQVTQNEAVKQAATDRVKAPALVESPAAAKKELRGEFIDSAVPDSPEDVGASRQFETGDVREFVNELPHKDAVPTKKFQLAVEGLRDISSSLARSMDPSRMGDTIQNGFHQGVIADYIIHPTRRMFVAAQEFQDQVRSGYQRILTKYDMQDKAHREAAGRVLEHITRADARGNGTGIFQKEAVQRILHDYSYDRAQQIIGTAMETRQFFDSLITVQNAARVKRGEAAMLYLDNYRPWIRKQSAFNKLLAGKAKGNEVPKEFPADQFMYTQMVQNPRAMARKGLEVPEDAIDDISELVVQYIDSARKDIYNNSIIKNARRHTKELRKQGKNGSAESIDQWVSEAFGGTPTPLSRALRSSGVPLVEEGLDFFMFVRRQLTRAVFPLNWTWNVFVQTSSSTLTIARYGVANSVRALQALWDPAMKAEIDRMAYSSIIKKRRGGRISQQDLGDDLLRHKEFDATKMSKVEDLANGLSTIIEENLTRHAVRAAYLKGEQLGLEGRSLWEYASNGGARTQSMYNKEDVVGVLRTKEVGTVGPFQTFAFEVFNTARELGLPGAKNLTVKGRKPFQEVGAYNTLLADSSIGTATMQNRVKTVLRWVGAAVAVNTISDRMVDRKPWNLGSFLPFYSLITAGAAGYGPTNQALFQKYSGDFWDGLRSFLATGKIHKFRDFFIRYHVLGGSQITRTLQGIEAVAEGGVRDTTGKKKFDVPKFSTDTAGENWQDWLNAYTRGVYATNGGKQYIEDRVDMNPFEEFIGFETGGTGGISGKMNRRYREEFEDYLDIATTIQERKENGQRYSRSQERVRNPELDAHLFVAGRVTSLKSRQAVRQAKQIILDEKLLNSADDSTIEGWRKGLGDRWVNAHIDNPDVEVAPLYDPDFVPLRGSSAAEKAEPTSAIHSAQENWELVSSLMSKGDLLALQKTWNGEGISRQERESLMAIYEQESLGATTFNEWLKQRLRQIQQNAAVAAKMQDDRELATV